jgi:hypothetical protein
MAAERHLFGGVVGKRGMVIKKFLSSCGDARSNLDLLRESLNDRVSSSTTTRHLLVLSSHQAASSDQTMLNKYLMAGVPSFSVLEMSRSVSTSQFLQRVTEELVRDDHILVISVSSSTLCSCLSALYHVVNKRYVIHGKRTYTRLATEDGGTVPVAVSSMFRLCVVVDPGVARSLSPPFLNRFEKQVLDYKDVVDFKVTDRMQERVYKSLHLSPNCFPPERVFVGYHDGFFASASLNLKDPVTQILRFVNPSVLSHLVLARENRMAAGDSHFTTSVASSSLSNNHQSISRLSRFFCKDVPTSVSMHTCVYSFSETFDGASDISEFSLKSEVISMLQRAEGHPLRFSAHLTDTSLEEVRSFQRQVESVSNCQRFVILAILAPTRHSRQKDQFYVQFRAGWDHMFLDQLPRRVVSETSPGCIVSLQDALAMSYITDVFKDADLSRNVWSALTRLSPAIVARLEFPANVSVSWPEFQDMCSGLAMLLEPHAGLRDDLLMMHLVSVFERNEHMLWSDETFRESLVCDGSVQQSASSFIFNKVSHVVAGIACPLNSGGSLALLNQPHVKDVCLMVMQAKLRRLAPVLLVLFKVIMADQFDLKRKLVPTLSLYACRFQLSSFRVI